MIYVASSWRNQLQPVVVEILREYGHEVYDFRNPSEGNTGFHWTNTGTPTYELVEGYDVPTVPALDYIKMLDHPTSQEGFKNDFDAMQACDTCILVLPCGRSAHLELGWFVGQGKRTAILLDGPRVTPELMYKMVDLIADRTNPILEWLVS